MHCTIYKIWINFGGKSCKCES